MQHQLCPGSVITLLGKQCAGWAMNVHTDPIENLDQVLDPTTEGVDISTAYVSVKRRRRTHYLCAPKRDAE